MSLQCPTSPVYGTSAEQKRQSRDAARKRRGTPKILRDMLREKCRIRLHEVRQLTYEKSRKLVDSFSEHESHAIDKILRQEVAELEKDIELQIEIYKELRAEADEWFVEQIENEENYLIEAAEADEVICPVCQKTTLSFGNSSIYRCDCGISFLFSGNKQHLQTSLSFKVKEHGQRCDAGLLFFIEPYTFPESVTNFCQNSSFILSAMCDNCDYFVSF